MEELESEVEEEVQSVQASAGTKSLSAPRDGGADTWSYW